MSSAPAPFLKQKRGDIFVADHRGAPQFAPLWSAVAVQSYHALEFLPKYSRNAKFSPFKLMPESRKGTAEVQLKMREVKAFRKIIYRQQIIIRETTVRCSDST